MSLTSTASVTLEQISFRDIDCPGDVLSYSCSIETNSENVQLTWRVTLPGQQMPLNITYDASFSPDSVNNLTDHITTAQTNYTSGMYIASTLNFTVPENAVANGTHLECLIGSLDRDMFYVSVNASGMNFHLGLKTPNLLYLSIFQLPLYHLTLESQK